MNRTVCRLLVVGMMAALLSFVTQPPQALAALAAPSNLSPSGISQSGAPVLQWSRVGKAVKYEVQLATDPGFTTLKYSATTTNHRATPTMTLPQQELFWRVRSSTPPNVKSNWNGQVHTPPRRSPVRRSSHRLTTRAAPSRCSSRTNPPAGPGPRCRTPLSYSIEIDDFDDFVGAKTFTSKTTSYLFQAADPTVPLNSWRVRAVFSGSYNSTWSDVGHFTVGALVAPTPHGSGRQPDDPGHRRRRRLGAGARRRDVRRRGGQHQRPVSSTRSRTRRPCLDLVPSGATLDNRPVLVARARDRRRTARPPRGPPRSTSSSAVGRSRPAWSSRRDFSRSAIPSTTSGIRSSAPDSYTARDLRTELQRPSMT